jgi:hypothetical protein
MARVDYVAQARGFVGVIDALAEFVGVDRGVLDRRIIRNSGASATFLNSLRHRKSAPPKGVDHGVFVEITRVLNELALKAAEKAEAHVREAEESGGGIDPRVYSIVCGLSARTKELMGEAEVERIKSNIADQNRAERVAV